MSDSESSYKPSESSDSEDFLLDDDKKRKKKSKKTKTHVMDLNFEEIGNNDDVQFDEKVVYSAMTANIKPSTKRSKRLIENKFEAINPDEFELEKSAPKKIYPAEFLAILEQKRKDFKLSENLNDKWEFDSEEEFRNWKEEKKKSFVSTQKQLRAQKAEETKLQMARLASQSRKFETAQDFEKAFMAPTLSFDLPKASASNDSLPMAKSNRIEKDDEDDDDIEIAAPSGMSARDAMRMKLNAQLNKAKAESLHKSFLFRDQSKSGFQKDSSSMPVPDSAGLPPKSDSSSNMFSNLQQNNAFSSIGTSNLNLKGGDSTIGAVGDQSAGVMRVGQSIFSAPPPPDMRAQNSNHPFNHPNRANGSFSIDKPSFAVGFAEDSKGGVIGLNSDVSKMCSSSASPVAFSPAMFSNNSNKSKSIAAGNSCKNTNSEYLQKRDFILQAAKAKARGVTVMPNPHASGSPTASFSSSYKTCNNFISNAQYMPSQQSDLCSPVTPTTEAPNNRNKTFVPKSTDNTSSNIGSTSFNNVNELSSSQGSLSCSLADIADDRTAIGVFEPLPSREVPQLLSEESFVSAALKTAPEKAKGDEEDDATQIWSYHPPSQSAAPSSCSSGKLPSFELNKPTNDVVISQTQEWHFVPPEEEKVNENEKILANEKNAPPPSPTQEWSYEELPTNESNVNVDDNHNKESEDIAETFKNDIETENFCLSKPVILTQKQKEELRQKTEEIKSKRDKKAAENEKKRQEREREELLAGSEKRVAWDSDSEQSSEHLDDDKENSQSNITERMKRRRGLVDDEEDEYSEDIRLRKEAKTDQAKSKKDERSSRDQAQSKKSKAATLRDIFDDEAGEDDDEDLEGIAGRRMSSAAAIAKMWGKKAEGSGDEEEEDDDDDFDDLLVATAEEAALDQLGLNGDDLAAHQLHLKFMEDQDAKLMEAVRLGGYRKKPGSGDGEEFEGMDRRQRLAEMEKRRAELMAAPGNEDQDDFEDDYDDFESDEENAFRDEDDEFFDEDDDNLLLGDQNEEARAAQIEELMRRRTRKMKQLARAILNQIMVKQQQTVKEVAPTQLVILKKIALRKAKTIVSTGVLDRKGVRATAWLDTRVKQAETKRQKKAKLLQQQNEDGTNAPSAKNVRMAFASNLKPQGENVNGQQSVSSVSSSISNREVRKLTISDRDSMFLAPSRSVSSSSLQGANSNAPFFIKSNTAHPNLSNVNQLARSALISAAKVTATKAASRAATDRRAVVANSSSSNPVNDRRSTFNNTTPVMAGANAGKGRLSLDSGGKLIVKAGGSTASSFASLSTDSEAWTSFVTAKGDNLVKKSKDTKPTTSSWLQNMIGK